MPLSITAHAPRASPDHEADVVLQATLRFPGDRLATLLFNRISHALERYLEMRIDCEKASIRNDLHIWNRRARGQVNLLGSVTKTEERDSGHRFILYRSTEGKDAEGLQSSR